jgi:hypothetical protein
LCLREHIVHAAQRPQQYCGPAQYAAEATGWWKKTPALLLTEGYDAIHKWFTMK